MMPNDVAIWERFIEKFPGEYDFVQYDVPCGTGPVFDMVVDEGTGATQERLYKKKIDVVASKEGEIYIIELKPDAGAGTVGQVKMYRRLYEKDYSPPVKPRCVIITNREIRDVREYAIEEGVYFVVV